MVYPPWNLQIAPENQWLEDEIPFGARPIFKGETLVSGRLLFSAIKNINGKSSAVTFLGVTEWLWLQRQSPIFPYFPTFELGNFFSKKNPPKGFIGGGEGNDEIHQFFWFVYLTSQKNHLGALALLSLVRSWIFQNPQGINRCNSSDPLVPCIPLVP